MAASDPAKRATTENAILAITSSSPRVTAVFHRQLFDAGTTLSLSQRQAGGRLQQSARAFQDVFQQGVRAIINASGDVRLENTLKELQRIIDGGNVASLVERLWREAEYLAREVGGSDARALIDIFGMSPAREEGESAAERTAKLFMMRDTQSGEKGP